MLSRRVLLFVFALVVGVALAAPHNLIEPGTLTNTAPTTNHDVHTDVDEHENMDNTRAEIETAVQINNPTDGFVKRTVAKRGIAFNSAGVVSQFKSPKVSWAYNWATNPAGSVSGVEYVPMLWGAKMFSYWNKDANAALASGSGHILGFNEPDIAEQANMSPQNAAAAYKQHITPLGNRASLGSPATTSAAEPGKGLDWMRQFFAACAGQCGINFMATHWYGNPGQVDYFKAHVNEAISVAKSNGINKIWVSEFGIWGSQGEQHAFLSQVMPWLDGKPEVARYAYFFASDGRMMNGNSINALGSQYINGF